MKSNDTTTEVKILFAATLGLISANNRLKPRYFHCW